MFLILFTYSNTINLVRITELPQGINPANEMLNISIYAGITEFLLLIPSSVNVSFHLVVLVNAH